MTTLIQNFEIHKLLPHRFPMQLVDQVVAFENGKEITAVKAVGIGEPSLKGHFPGFPIFPGVLLVEALGQTCALMLELTNRNWIPGTPITENPNATELGVLGGMKINLKTPVLPGTLVYLNAVLDWTAGPASSLKVTAFNGDTVFAKGSITVAKVNKDQLLPKKEMQLV